MTYIGQHKYKKLNDTYMGKGKRLRAAQKEFGIKNFKKDILVFNISKQEHANLLEKTFIKAEREKVGIENCYNEADGGKGGNGSKGRKFGPRSEEVKIKIAEALKGKPHPHTEEQDRKLSESLKGHPVSEETKRKISDTLKAKPDLFKGRPSNKKGLHWKLVDGKRVYYK